MKHSNIINALKDNSIRPEEINNITDMLTTTVADPSIDRQEEIVQSVLSKVSSLTEGIDISKVTESFMTTYIDSAKNSAHCIYGYTIQSIFT